MRYATAHQRDLISRPAFSASLSSYSWVSFRVPGLIQQAYRNPYAQAIILPGNLVYAGVSIVGAKRTASVCHASLASQSDLYFSLCKLSPRRVSPPCDLRLPQHLTRRRRQGELSQVNRKQVLRRLHDPSRARAEPQGHRRVHGLERAPGTSSSGCGALLRVS